MLERKLGFEAWISSGFKRSTKQNYRIGYELFLEFMNETEEGSWNDARLIKEREADISNHIFAFEQKLVEFYEWLKGYISKDREIEVNRSNAKPYTIKIKGGKKLSDNTRQTYTHGVRSFFAFHRLDLKFTRQQARILTQEPKPIIQYYEFTLDDIKQMSRVAKPKERYVLLVGRSIGLRGCDFVALTQGTFLAHLDETAPCSLGEIYTQKEGVYATPFLDADAKEAAQSWLTILKGKGRFNRDQPMITISDEMLTEIIKKLVVKAGVEVGNQQIRFHQLRVFLITRLSKVMEENRWKQLVGKKVPESAYVKPFQVREDFEKVVPLISIRPREDVEAIVERRVQERTRELKAEIDSLKQWVDLELKNSRDNIIQELKKHGLTMKE